MKEDVQKTGRVLLFLVLAIGLTTAGALIWTFAGAPRPSLARDQATPKIPLDQPKKLP